MIFASLFIRSKHAIASGTCRIKIETFFHFNWVLYQFMFAVERFIFSCVLLTSPFTRGDKGKAEKRILGKVLRDEHWSEIYYWECIMENGRKICRFLSPHFHMNRKHLMQWPLERLVIHDPIDVTFDLRTCLEIRNFHDKLENLLYN